MCPMKCLCAWPNGTSNLNECLVWSAWRSAEWTTCVGTTFNCRKLYELPDEQTAIFKGRHASEDAQIFLQHNGVSPQFGYQVTAYLHQYYKNQWLSHCGPLPWLLRSLDLILLDSFL